MMVFPFLTFVLESLFSSSKPLNCGYPKMAEGGKELTLFPDDKILVLSKLKAFADDRLTVNQNIKFVFHIVENIIGKVDNAGYQHFELGCFQRKPEVLL